MNTNDSLGSCNNSLLRVQSKVIYSVFSRTLSCPPDYAPIDFVIHINPYFLFFFTPFCFLSSAPFSPILPTASFLILAIPLTLHYWRRFSQQCGRDDLRETRRLLPDDYLGQQFLADRLFVLAILSKMSQQF